MKESDEKENPSTNPENESFSQLLERLFGPPEKGNYRIGNQNSDEFTVILNPPKSLVDKLRKAKEKVK